MRRNRGFASPHPNSKPMSPEEVNAVVQIVSSQMARLQGSLDAALAGQARIIAHLEGSDDKTVLHELNRLESTYTERRMEESNNAAHDAIKRILGSD